MVQADDQERYENLGAVAVLHGPSWDEPAFKQFQAVHPRPQCQATYEVGGQPIDGFLLQRTPLARLDHGFHCSFCDGSTGVAGMTGDVHAQALVAMPPCACTSAL